MWRWVFLSLGWLWYSWRVYTLTVNWATFPNPDSARAIWQKRSTFSLWLGAAVLNDTFYAIGLIERWWVIALSLLGCFLVIGIVQPFLIRAALVLTMWFRGRKMARGKDPTNSFFGELAVWQYLTPAERKAHKQMLGTTRDSDLPQDPDK